VLDEARDIEPLHGGLRRGIDARYRHSAGQDHRLPLLLGHLADLLHARRVRRERDAPRQPALAEVDREPRGRRRRAAPPDRHRLQRLRLEVNVLELVTLAVPFDGLTGPEAARDEDLLLHHLNAVLRALTEDLELVVERARSD